MRINKQRPEFKNTQYLRKGPSVKDRPFLFIISQFTGQAPCAKHTPSKNTYIKYVALLDTNKK